MLFSGVEKLVDKQIRRKFLIGNKTIMKNCKCEKIDESDRD